MIHYIKNCINSCCVSCVILR